MYDRSPTTYHASPTPSHTDILLEQIRRELWATREDLGGVKAGIAMLVKSQEHGFRKIDKAHERITRGEEAHSQLEEQVTALLNRPATPAGAAPPIPPSTPPGFLASSAALFRAMSAAVPPLKELLTAAAMLAASIALLWQTPTGSPPSPAAPPVSAISAPP